MARKNLRDIFLNADAAMTGANFAVASTGEVVVCTNEGNADMGMSCPKLNISAFGLEKIVPDMGGVRCLYPSVGPLGHRTTQYHLYVPFPLSA